MDLKNINIGELIKETVAQNEVEMSRICSFLKCSEDQTDIVKSGSTEGSLNIFNYQVVKSAVGNVNEFITQGNPTYKILTGVRAN